LDASLVLRFHLAASSQEWPYVDLMTNVALSPIPFSSLWTETAGSLHQDLEFKDFAEAWAYMQAIAVEAEKQDHHPNWSNVWNQVTIDLTSHDKGNSVTKRDHRLAAAADEALRDILKPRATTFAETFTERLVGGQFVEAHTMLHPDLAATMSAVELRERFMEMDNTQDPFTKWSVDEEFLMTQWPDRTDADLLWAYCSVFGTGVVEAVTLHISMTRGSPKNLGVRVIEFGRP
jgi:4a-hydroxytetrahydrobiopterin dehydratase